MKKKKIFLSNIIGNILDHYDSSLYIFMAPLLSQKLFPQYNTSTSMILMYIFKSISLISKPIGNIIFGYLSLKFNIQKLFSITLIGTAIFTGLIGIIPEYKHINIMSPIIFIIIKSLQNIFTAGEQSISSILILENTTNLHQSNTLNSYYIISTICGTLLASIATFIVSKIQHFQHLWRICFLLGFITAIVGITIRKNTKYQLKKHKQKKYYTKISNIFIIIIINSFSFLTYIVPFIFLNNFIILFNKIKIQDLLMHNNLLIIIDILLLLISAKIIKIFSLIKLMLYINIIFTTSIIPIFYWLPSITNIKFIILIKLYIIILGVGFAIPINTLLKILIPHTKKYFINSLGYAIGIEILGKNILTMCLISWYITKSTINITIYIILISILSIISLLYLNAERKGFEPLIK